jgi:LuxR family maltose regulon positive regulatory protein
MAKEEADESLTVGLYEDGSRQPTLDLIPPDCVLRPGPPGDTSRIVARDDVIDHLNAVTSRKVTIISAPAGSGKTSLLHAWANGPGRAHRIAFVTVDRDEHAQKFWLAMLAAVRWACGATSHAEPSTATPDFEPRTLVDSVLSEFADPSGPGILIIDDLHELNSPDALRHLSHLLMNLPPKWHAILATRHDLRLGLHQLRLAGELAEIRTVDLRFSERETRELLAASDIGLSEAGAALLHQRTEGWAAGLRLAVLSLAGHPDPERFVAEFSGNDRAVAEYLFHEMLERQPGHIQDLLLRTSPLDRINGELADLLTGHPGSERILLDLEDANAFVVSLDPGRTWFRYHHLFGDLLRLELRRALPGQVAVLHRLAARWFVRHGLVADAIRHTQAAGDWADAARLLADHAFILTMDGKAQTVRTLLLAFPEGADYPELALIRAGQYVAQGRLDETAAHLTVAEATARATNPDRQRRLRVAIASLYLSLATRRCHLAGVLEQAKFLDAPATGHSVEDLVVDSDLRALALMSLGTVEASLGLAGAERHLRTGAVLARKIGRPYLEVRCLLQLGFASRTCSFATAQRRCREAIALAEQHGWAAEWFVAPALITLASTMVWTGEFDEGERWLQRTTQVLQTDTGPDIGLLVAIVNGMLLAARDRRHEALEHFSAAERLQSQLNGPHALASQAMGWMLATQARLGMHAEARTVLTALNDERASSGEIRNADAAICLAEGDPAGALGAVRHVFDGDAPVVGFVTIVESHLLAALAHVALGDQRAANRAVERALALAEPDRLVLPFVMTGSQELLEGLPRQETAHAGLLRCILDTAWGSSVIPSGHPAPLAQALSPTELRVLRYLPTNLSRNEIAEQLSVSPHTVGTHLRSIYTKFGAGSRSAAVQRARELRLLSANRTLGAAHSSTLCQCARPA